MGYVWALGLITTGYHAAMSRVVRVRDGGVGGGGMDMHLSQQGFRYLSGGTPGSDGAGGVVGHSKVGHRKLRPSHALLWS